MSIENEANQAPIDEVSVDEAPISKNVMADAERDVTAAEADVAEAEQAAAEEEDQMTPDELADACEARATVYGFLARLYRTEVTEELYEELCAMHYPVTTGNKLMDHGYYLIALHLSNAWVDPIMQLQKDYSKTFLGSGIDTYSAAYPFESVFTGERRLMMGDARDEVLAIYRANGLSKAQSWKVGEDHIAVELEFLRIMNVRAAKALREGDMDTAYRKLNTTRNFIADHIAVWVPVFTSEMRRFADTDFYCGLADITEGFIAEEQLLLNDLLIEEAEETSLKEAIIQAYEEGKASGDKPQEEAAPEAATSTEE